jgi:hypothetical protein
MNANISLEMLTKKIMPVAHTVGTHVAIWTKRGGHAGQKQLDKIEEKALALGFEKCSSTVTGSQLGHVRHQRLFRHPDGFILGTSASYGTTKEQNRFHAELFTHLNIASI